MKLGIAIGHLGLGGAERVSTNLAKWLVNQGHEVSFYNTKEPAAKEYSIPSVIKRYFCFSNSKLGIMKNMRKAILSDKPDVVLVMGTPMCVYVIPSMIGLGIPTVVSERSSPNNARIKKSTRLISNLLMRSADKFVFQTKGAQDYFGEKIKRESVIIPNPIIIDEIPSHYQGKRKKRIVSVGRLVKEKNYQLLINAFNEFHKTYSDFTLDIFGDGSERDNLQAIIENLNAVEYIRLNKSRNDVLFEILDSYAFVLSSDLEGMPNALIEAMAIGLPCVSTDCPSGGPAELIKDGVNGLLVPVKDNNALVAALSKIAYHEDLSKKLSEKAVEIREVLDINNVGKKWENTFLSLIKN